MIHKNLFDHNKFGDSINYNVLVCNQQYSEKKIAIKVEEIESIEDLELKAKFITMISPFTTQEKQALLEKYELNSFYETLISILKLYSSGQKDTLSIN